MTKKATEYERLPIEYTLYKQDDFFNCLGWDKIEVKALVFEKHKAHAVGAVVIADGHCLSIMEEDWENTFDCYGPEKFTKQQIKSQTQRNFNETCENGNYSTEQCMLNDKKRFGLRKAPKFITMSERDEK